MDAPPTPPTTKKTRRRPLKTQADLRRALAHVYGALEAGSIDVTRARVMIYALATLSAVHERHEMEGELEMVKKALIEAGFMKVTP